MIWYIAIDDPKLLLFVVRIRQEKRVACRTYLTIIKSLERCLKTNLTANYCLKKNLRPFTENKLDNHLIITKICVLIMTPDRTTFRPESHQPDKLSFKSKNANFYHQKIKTDGLRENYTKLLFLDRCFLH